MRKIVYCVFLMWALSIASCANSAYAAEKTKEKPQPVKETKVVVKEEVKQPFQYGLIMTPNSSNAVSPH